MTDKIDFNPDVWAGLSSDKERWEALGCNEKQMRAINVLFNYPVISPSTLEERRRLSDLDKDKETSDGRNT